MKIFRSGVVLLGLLASLPAGAALVGEDLGWAAQLLGDSVEARSAARALAGQPSRSRELNDLMADVLWRACIGRRALDDDAQAWLAKALGRTRDARYWDVLADCAEKSPGEKVRDEADAAQDGLAADNPPQFIGGSLDLEAIRRTATAAASDGQVRSARAERVRRDLDSNEPQAIARTAKDLLALHETDRAVLDEVAARLYLSEPATDAHRVKALALLCRVLADSGDGRYRSFLERVSERAESRRLRGYAAAAAAALPDDDSWQWSYRAPKKKVVPAPAPEPPAAKPKARPKR